MKFNTKLILVCGILCLMFLLNFVESSRSSKSQAQAMAQARTKYNDQFSLLKELIKQEGGNVHDIVLDMGNKRDKVLVCNEDVEKDKELLRVPSSLILTDEHPEIKPICDKVKAIFAEEIQQDAFNFCVSIFVHNQKHNHSHKLSPFFKLLPKSYKTFPIFYNQKQMDKLKNSFLLNSINKDRDVLNYIYNKLKNSKQLPMKNISLKEFLKTYYAINSRNFLLPKVNKKAIVPCGDLFNFNPHNINISYDYDNNSNEFIIKSLKPIKKGEELNLDYGNFSNKDLLFNYGFSVDDVNRNHSPIHIDLDSKDQLILSLEDYNPLVNSKKVVKKDKNAMHNMIVYTSLLADILNKYPTTLDHDIKKLRKLRKVDHTPNIDVLRVLTDEKRTILGGYHIGNAIIYLLSAPEDPKIQACEKINKDLLKIIKANQKIYQRELQKFKFNVLPVEDYKVYERDDVLNYLNDILRSKR